MDANLPYFQEAFLHENVYDIRTLNHVVVRRLIELSFKTLY